VRDYPSVVIDDAAADAISHGRRLAAPLAAWPGAGPWAVVDAGGGLLAMYERADDWSARPLVVLAGQ
jgi:hypothetical protein